MNAAAGWEVRGCAGLRGRIAVPADKSISHRAALLAAMAGGTSRVRNFLASDDCLNLLGVLSQLGVAATRDGATVEVRGVRAQLTAPVGCGALDMGNSGTGLRLMAGLLAGQPFVSELTGDESLRSRPMGRIREPLERMGARIELLGPRGTAPVRIHGAALAGVEYCSPVASAQVKSCVLIAGLLARGRTSVTEPAASRDHTERMLRLMGAPVAVEGLTATVEGDGERPDLRPLDVTVPGDFSSAAYWLLAGSAVEGAEVTVEDVGLNPRRTAFLDVLVRMGARIRVEPGCASEWEPRGTVTVSGSRLRGIEVCGPEVANLIDELPLVAVAGALAEGRTVIREAAELRVKESDRIATVAEGLRRFGVRVEERPDGMLIEGCRRVRGGVETQSHGDHRVAMAMAVLGSCAPGGAAVRNVVCVGKSYPGFLDDLRRLGGEGVVT